MPKTIRRPWNRDELLVTFALYCRLPFGQLHSHNPSIVECAKLLGRSPSAVSMKMVNFASLDPYHEVRGVSGLKNVSKADRGLWEEFRHDSEALAYECEMAKERLKEPEKCDLAHTNNAIDLQRATERESTVRTRLVQGFFRRTVLAAYDYRCAFCELETMELLNASHIIPWRESVPRRGDPTNGLALCALHDRAFDRGLVGLNESGLILVSARLRDECRSPVAKIGFLDLEGKSMRLPWRFKPDEDAVEFHRVNIYRA